MNREAIGDGPIGAAGQMLLTTQFGRTRPAETLRASGEARTATAGPDGKSAARRDGATAATRP